MQYTMRYRSPLGGILLAADGEGMTGLWFDGQKYFAKGLASRHEERSLPELEEAKRWLDSYFSGREPNHMPPLHPIGTAFQTEVWGILSRIPYGRTVTYGAIAKELAQRRDVPRFSAQAVGGAVGRNELSLLIPCHRVVGGDGSLTGYAGGLEKKAALLRLEGVPLRGYALETAAGA